MKIYKSIFGLSCLTIITICILNIQSSMNVSNELGFSNLTSLITLNSASAEEGGDDSCTGSSCDSANGNNYGYIEVNGKGYCCGGAATSSGKKSS